MLLKILLTILIFSSFYILLELIKRKSTIKREYTRKIAHIVSAILAISLYFFLARTEFIIATTFFTIFFAVSYSKKFLNSIHLKNYKTFGEIFYPLALVALGIFYYDKPFIMISSIAIMGFADGISGIYNLKHKKKSLDGSLIFFLISIVLILINYAVFIDDISLPIIFRIILVSAIISIVEYISHFGTDNFTVPLSSAILLSIMLLI